MPCHEKQVFCSRSAREDELLKTWSHHFFCYLLLIFEIRCSGLVRNHAPWYLVQHGFPEVPPSDRSTMKTERTGNIGMRRCHNAHCMSKFAEADEGSLMVVLLQNWEGRRTRMQTLKEWLTWNDAREKEKRASSNYEWLPNCHSQKNQKVFNQFQLPYCRKLSSHVSFSVPFSNRWRMNLAYPACNFL